MKELAEKLFKKGVGFEVIKSTFNDISEEELRKIFNEVKQEE